ncbi:MAG: GNAT family N-acetyltransferase [Clostridiales bacterium]|jgi:predicted N-acetyltransferase YhbS|nr:GNAT family N-acetyltransferase [Clostridiales bacterium]
MRSFLIRRATAVDAPQVLSLTHRAFVAYKASISADVQLKALTEQLWDVESDITDNHVLVAFQDDVLVGSIRFSLLSPDVAYIYRFGVDPDSKNGGIGTNLLGAAVDEIKALGAKAVTLHTNAKYYTLARYYYGKEFYVHSTDASKGYIRAFFVKELYDTGLQGVDLSVGLKK